MTPYDYLTTLGYPEEFKEELMMSYCPDVLLSNNIGFEKEHYIKSRIKQSNNIGLCPAKIARHGSLMSFCATDERSCWRTDPGFTNKEWAVISQRFLVDSLYDEWKETHNCSSETTNTKP